MFLIGLLGSAVFTVLFSSIGGYTAMWCLNRFLQSVGWGALVKIVSQWFDTQVSPAQASPPPFAQPRRAHLAGDG